MRIIPDQEEKKLEKVNLAPMVDVLFLVVAIFAVLAISRASLYDTEMSLVKLKPESEHTPSAMQSDHYLVNLSVTEDGKYKWLTEVNEYYLQNLAALQHELIKQRELGIIPADPEHTKILLHIDRKAEWEPISKMIFAVREAGFNIYPVYESTDR